MLLLKYFSKIKRKQLPDINAFKAQVYPCGNSVVVLPCGNSVIINK